MPDPISCNSRASDPYLNQSSESASICREAATCATASSTPTSTASAPSLTGADEAVTPGGNALLAQHSGAESPAARAARFAKAERVTKCQEAKADTAERCSMAVAATLGAVAGVETLVGEFALAFAAGVAINSCFRGVERERIACERPTPTVEGSP